MVELRGAAAEQGGAECNPDQDLDDDERHRAAQKQAAPDHDGQHQDRKRLDQEDQLWAHAASPGLAGNQGSNSGGSIGITCSPIAAKVRETNNLKRQASIDHDALRHDYKPSHSTVATIWSGRSHTK